MRSAELVLVDEAMEGLPVDAGRLGRSGFGRLILGSVAESVLRGATTPILLLRVPGAPVEAPWGAGQARPTKEPAHV